MFYKEKKKCKKSQFSFDLPKYYQRIIFLYQLDWKRPLRRSSPTVNLNH